MVYSPMFYQHTSRSPHSPPPAPYQYKGPAKFPPDTDISASLFFFLMAPLQFILHMVTVLFLSCCGFPSFPDLFIPFGLLSRVNST